MHNDERIIEAIKTIVWYNGYTPVLQKIKEELIMDTFNAGNYEHCDVATGEIHFIAELLVLLFGNYGTSPRCGWVHNYGDNDIQGAIKFIDSIITEED